jgi:dihydrofolate reductase
MISIIVAMTNQGVIGKGGELPWPRISGDLPRFKKITMGHPVIMGRNTFESLPKKPLEGRTNIVITSRPEEVREGVPVNSFNSAMEVAQKSEGSEEIFVIGGGRVYKTALLFAQKIYLTLVLEDYHGDTFFPLLLGEDPEWGCEEVNKISKENPSHQFLILKRIKEVVDPTYAKDPEYSKILKKIQSENKCPFCSLKYHSEPVLKRSGSWFITRNFKQYENSDHHFIILSERHFERLEGASVPDFACILELAKWAENEFNLQGGALCMRFGKPTHTGATVYHFHAHLIVPQIDPKKGRAYSVNFPIG